MGTFFSKSYSPNCQDKTPAGRPGTISRMESTSQYIEAVVCNQNDLKDNEMKVFEVGDEGRVLLVKQKGEFSAVGTKCTHYGAPLVNGALGDGRIRCPWHGACFNLKTGDIEDFPGFDSLPCYQVTVGEKGEVKVRAKTSDLKSNKRIKDMGVVCTCEGSSSVVIVGGGPSGATCAETLRSEGYKGRITIVAKENCLPYDRIKVSKIGTVTEFEKLQARTPEYYEGANIEILKGIEAVSVDAEEKHVRLSNGKSLKYSHLYLATGSKPRTPEIKGINATNVYTVRDFADAMNILTAIGSGKDKDVVVLGASFIGLESAASCVDKAKSMTLIGKYGAPLEHVFGKDIAESIQKLIESKGVKYISNATIEECISENGILKSVALSNGTTLTADVLILGVGTTFYTDFLKGSGIDMEADGGVKVNNKLETNVKSIYAGGDIAKAPVFAHGSKSINIGHVGLAQYHGRIAALNIAKKETELRTVPYFWTALFGKSIRYAGHGRHSSILVDGDIAELKFVIFFFDDSDKVIAVASCQRDPVVSQFAELLYQGKPLYKKDLKDDRFAWTKNIN